MSVDATPASAPGAPLPEPRLVPAANAAAMIPAQDAWLQAPSLASTVSAARLAYVIVGKRAIDLVAATILLVLLTPFLVAIAIWIRIDAPGNPIFTQQRVGQRQRPFTIYKFRSMRRNADHLIERDPTLQAAYATNWKLPDDPRITKPGAVLRRWSLDELPQLLNVLKGDMSLVGPRPYMPHELDGRFGDHARIITALKPGITGLWQVSGRSSLTPVDRIALDERYVHTCGLGHDLRIAFRTLKVVLVRKGAW